MKYLLYLVTLFLFFGCNTKIEEEELKHLNGYWEISKVTFPNGETKDFKVNPIIDYIEIEGLEGFRKKVYPKFDGTYETSNDADNFKIELIDGNFQFNYNPNMAIHSSMHRRETLIQLSDISFSVVNKDTVTYSYKRFQPINATE